jgi:hypothetical protein
MPRYRRAGECDGEMQEVKSHDSSLISGAPEAGITSTHTNGVHNQDDFDTEEGSLCVALRDGVRLHYRMTTWKWSCRYRHRHQCRMQRGWSLQFYLRNKGAGPRGTNIWHANYATATRTLNTTMTPGETKPPRRATSHCHTFRTNPGPDTGQNHISNRLAVQISEQWSSITSGMRANLSAVHLLATLAPISQPCDPHHCPTLPCITGEY